MQISAIPDGEYPNRVPPDVVVSVYMITYNHAPYIAQAIESVLMQRTDFPFELCIGEDRSTDGTRAICIRYAEQYPDKIRLFLRSEEEKAKGRTMPPGRWNGYLTRSACRGEFVAILEGDDFWIDSMKLQRQIDYIRAHPECMICATRAVVWRLNGSPGSYINPDVILRKINTRHMLSGNGGIVNTCTLLYRRGSFADWLSWSAQIVGGDWALLVSALDGGSYCAILPAVSAVYRVHDGGSWQGVKRSKADYQAVVVSYLQAYSKICRPEIKNAVLKRIRYYKTAELFYRSSGIKKIVVLALSILEGPVVCVEVFRSLLIKALKKMESYASAYRHSLQDS